jgi:hypothetical protein
VNGPARPPDGIAAVGLLSGGNQLCRSKEDLSLLTVWHGCYLACWSFAVKADPLGIAP